MNRGRILFLCSLLLISFLFVCADQKEYPLAVPEFYPDSIEWFPLDNNAQYMLRVSCPDGTVIERSFDFGYAPYLSFSEKDGVAPLDGVYTYELIQIPNKPAQTRGEMDTGEFEKNPQPTVSQSGHFRIQDGVVVVAGEAEELSAEKDIMHLDDVITTGSLCVGFDCINGENFGFDTIRLKENNLRIHFQDTSNSASFPTRDWRIIINDSVNGGASYFAVEDSDSARQVFKIEGGTRTNSFYVNASGRVGLGTATPSEELHVVFCDTPAVRLDQNNSCGWAAQAWDVAGNEANFFIRDVTNGSKLPFRIQPGTPTSTLCLRSDGNVGIGTWSPAQPLEIETTGRNSEISLQRTDGATLYVNATDSYGNFGTVSDHPLRLAVNGIWRFRLDNDNSLTMKNNAVCTTGGQWQDASSREYKQNVRNLSSDEAMAALECLEPVKYNYKADSEEECLGFIAEDVPDLVATKSRKSMSSMDVVAVLTKVVQQQQKTIAELKKKVEDLEKMADKK